METEAIPKVSHDRPGEALEAQVRLFRIVLHGVETGRELVVHEYALNRSDAIDIATRNYAPAFEVVLDQVTEIF